MSDRETARNVTIAVGVAVLVAVVALLAYVAWRGASVIDRVDDDTVDQNAASASWSSERRPPRPTRITRIS